MFKLEKLNVVRFVENELQKSKLINEGFKEIKQIQNKNINEINKIENEIKQKVIKGKATK